MLSLLEERAPIDVLISLLDHKNPETRKQTAVAMDHLLTRIPIETIVNKLRDRNKGVRRTAGMVLLRNDIDIPADLLMPFIDTPENIARATAIELLGDRLPLSCLLAIARDDHKWTVRAAALKVLGSMGTQVPLDLFLEALCDKSLRLAALIALGKQKERIPIPIVIGALYGRWRMNLNASDILVQLGKRVPRELLLALLDDPMAYVRVTAIRLLTTIEYDEPFPFDMVRDMLQDCDASVREAAIEVLDKLEVIEPVESWIAALSNDHSEVRNAALDALTKAGKRSPQELEQIKALLGDSETYHSAIACLKKNHMEVLREVAQEASNILMYKGSGQVLGSRQQEYIVDAIGNMNNPGPLLVDKLLELLDWPYGRVHIKAKQSLRQRGH